MKSGAISCYMCCKTYLRRSHSLSKFSNNLFQYAVTIQHPTDSFSFGQGIYSWILASTKGSYPTANRYPCFIGSGSREARFHFLVQNKGIVQFTSYLVRDSEFRVLSLTIFHSCACRPKLMQLWVRSWDRLQMALTIRWNLIQIMMWMDIAFTQQATSELGPIEKPQTVEFVLPALMALVSWHNWRNLWIFILWSETSSSHHVQMPLVQSLTNEMEP
jgi:hypothetical protein